METVMNQKAWMLINVVVMSVGFISSVFAKPESDVLNTLNAEVLRVEVVHQNGKHGLGSGVVIAKDQLVTNCHVVTNASDVKVVVNGIRHVATGVKPDWHHDICIIQVPGIDVPLAKIGKSNDLHYQTPVVTVGYPDITSSPVNSFGEVVGLFPMDGGMVIRATSEFNLGASGGGIFDEHGNLVGVITLKSRGADAQYFFMPVEWVLALLNKPLQALGLDAHKPFWAKDVADRPYFMKVVQPIASQDWMSLKAVSLAWVGDEPNSAESWAHLAMAEFETQDFQQALLHFKKALSLHHDDKFVKDYLNKLEAHIAFGNIDRRQFLATLK
jgi:serine protease Do